MYKNLVTEIMRSVSLTLSKLNKKRQCFN